MTYGICNLAVVPMRAEASDKSEMISQVLFGEHFEILEEVSKWIKIKLVHDQYEGWICKKQYTEIPSSYYDELSLNYLDFPKCNRIFTSIKWTKTAEQQNITLGAILPYYNKETGIIYKNHFHLKNDEIDKGLIDFAKSLLNTPYLWGGRSPLGIDCSGFIQLCYRMVGKFLPRDAYQQVEEGTNVNFIETAEPGDLAFFDNEEGNINHVALIIEPGTVIHASGKVRIDPLDHHGIFNKEINQYSHKLRIIKRIS